MKITLSIFVSTLGPRIKRQGKNHFPLGSNGAVIGYESFLGDESRKQPTMLEDLMIKLRLLMAQLAVVLNSNALLVLAERRCMSLHDRAFG